MKTAIIGLPMTGKTSLFTILTGVQEARAWARRGAQRRHESAGPAPGGSGGGLSNRPKSPTPPLNISTSRPFRRKRCAIPSYLASLRVVDALAHVVRVFQRRHRAA